LEIAFNDTTREITITKNPNIEFNKKRYYGDCLNLSFSESLTNSLAPDSPDKGRDLGFFFRTEPNTYKLKFHDPRSSLLDHHRSVTFLAHQSVETQSYVQNRGFSPVIAYMKEGRIHLDLNSSECYLSHPFDYLRLEMIDHYNESLSFMFDVDITIVLSLAAVPLSD
jgi:hypothetical protein